MQSNLFIYVFSAKDRDTLINRGHECILESSNLGGTVYIFEATDDVEFDDVRHVCSDTLPI